VNFPRELSVGYYPVKVPWGDMWKEAPQKEFFAGEQVFHEFCSII